jgi:hypothetical protein
MAIKLKDGTIYFLRERSVGDGSFTPYCKIGLVANDRTTAQRIKEHQTGNPREIVEVFSVSCCAVTSLETYLHERYATARISGEWFRLPEDQCNEAIDEARATAELLLTKSELIASSRALKSVESTEPQRPPTPDEELLHEELLDLHKELLRIREQQALIELEIRQLMGAQPGIRGVVDVVFTDPTSQFNQQRFQAEHPELHERFLVPQPDRLSSTFRLSGKPTARGLEKSMLDEKKRLKALTDAIVIDASAPAMETKPEGVDVLQEKYLTCLRQRSGLQLQVDLRESALQAACGRAEGIEGVCDWRREHKPVAPKFDEVAFRASDQALYDRFVEEKPATPRVSLKPYRPLPGVA